MGLFLVFIGVRGGGEAQFSVPRGAGEAPFFGANEFSASLIWTSYIILT